MKRSTSFVLGCMLALSLTHSARAQNAPDCGDQYRKILTTAQFYAAGELSSALNYLASLRGSSPDFTRFNYWFGTNDLFTVRQVEAMLQDVYQAVDDVTYSCTCDPTVNANAYVYATKDYVVHMCRPYFDAFARGDMLMSTVVHEISHLFNSRDCTKPSSQGPCCYGTMSDPPSCIPPGGTMPVADPQPNSQALAHTFAMSALPLPITMPTTSAGS